MKKIDSNSTLIVINNEGGRILPSETFFTAHINQLSKPVVPIVGIPGHRILINHGRKTIPSRRFASLAVRWLTRHLGISTIQIQDRRAVAKFLRQHKISVVLAEYGPTAVSVMEACKSANVPLVVHFHGFDAYTSDVLSTYHEKYFELFKQAKAIVAVSEHMRRQLISLGAKDDDVFVNSCGADIPQGQQAHPGTATKRFLMVGRLVEKKAPFLSIMAFSKVVDKFPDSQLDIIGDGPLQSACQQIAGGLNISNRVIFHGAQSHEKVFDMMKESRCFIQHSVRTPNNDHEGTPVGLLEAMGMGLAVVATRHGGIIDVIKNEITGSLVDEYDVNAMASAMLAYAEDAALAQRIGDKARASILEKLTSKKSVDRLQNIIRMASSKNIASNE